MVRGTTNPPRLLFRGAAQLIRNRKISSFTSGVVRSGACWCVNNNSNLLPFSRRTFSSRSNNRSPNFQADALPFSVSPEEARKAFDKWARNKQGLGWLLNSSSVKMEAVFCPVWSFTLNVRFVVTDEDGRRRFNWKPDIFSAYGAQSVVHLPGLAAYAGYNYRRSLMHPLHNTTLVFLGDQTVPFGKWMLRDMPLDGTTEKLTPFPDPWNTTRGRALSLVKEELHALAEASTTEQTTVQAEVVSSRRVYLPTYVIHYQLLGVSYQAFVSGCDAGAGVSGVSHQVFPSTTNVTRASQDFLTQAFGVAQSSARVLGGRQIGTLIVVALQLVGNLLARVLMRLPLIGLLGGVFVGFRKILQPWLDHRWASAEWERQREHERTMQDGASMDRDDFTDTGAAKRFYQNNRSRILQSLSGETEHDQGDFDWYKEWEAWARQQFQQQQQQQQTYQQTYQQQTHQQQTYQQQRRTTQRPRTEYQWDFDPKDPYAVLGIRRGATKSEVAAAFRKQMAMHHPDTLANASEAERARSTERSKLITEAYQKIKSEMKR